MRKYIIKNCPSISLNECNSFRDDEIFCEDCTDCVLKQIVDYCLDNEKYGDMYYTDPILKLLEIQEA